MRLTPVRLNGKRIISMRFLPCVKTLSRLKGQLFPLAVFLSTALLPDGYADESTKSGGSPVESKSAERQSVGAKARMDALTDLKRKLSEAKTPEEKRALIEDFRAKNEVLVKQRESSLAKQQSPEIRLAELKAKAAGNPEMLARLDVVEARLKSVDLIKSKIAEAQAATGEKRQQLLNDVRREIKLSQARPAEMSVRLPEAKLRNVESTKDLPPEMAALKAKSEARKAEMDQFREALTKASPKERSKLLDDWRAKRQAEMESTRTKVE